MRERPRLPDHPLAPWLALARLPGVRSATWRALLDAGLHPAQLWTHAGAGLNLPPVAREHLHHPPRAEIEHDLAWLEAVNHSLVLVIDPAYPERLRVLPDAPLALFVDGDTELLRAPAVAIVGSRNPSPEGRENAFAIAHALARAGLVVVSGLALGIDGAAHGGALAAGGLSVAVAGTGLDQVYPPAHSGLAASIRTEGALISEFPPGTPARRAHFPQRNRIISGLCLGTLVVEAAARSGSLITARLAAEQGREVFAVPGSIHNPRSRGCHRLLRQGAKLVETAADVLEELASQIDLDTGPLTETPGMAPGSRRRHHDKILKYIGFDPVSVDQLVSRSGLTPESVSSMLLVLELEGEIQSGAGGWYYRVRRMES